MTASLLYIHSTGTLPSLWSALPDEKLQGALVLRPANLGYPPNPPLERPAPFTVADEVAHLLAKLPAQGPVHLVAHSYGGLVALKLARALGPRTASLFLFEPVLFGALTRAGHAPAAAMEEARAFARHEGFLDDARGGDDAWMTTFIDYWNRPGSWARMPEPMREFARFVSWKMYQEVRAVFFDGSDFEEHALAAPLTLVKAQRSPQAPRAMVDELARVNPQAKVVELLGTGHMAPLTHPALVAQALEEHLAPLGLVRPG
jgi:pimeloyl-ACP methyl ester carboxylesterase